MTPSPTPDATPESSAAVNGKATKTMLGARVWAYLTKSDSAYFMAIASAACRAHGQTPLALHPHALPLGRISVQTKPAARIDLDAHTSRILCKGIKKPFAISPRFSGNHTQELTYEDATFREIVESLGM